MITIGELPVCVCVCVTEVTIDYEQLLIHQGLFIPFNSGRRLMLDRFLLYIQEKSIILITQPPILQNDNLNSI